MRRAAFRLRGCAAVGAGALLFSVNAEGGAAPDAPQEVELAPVAMRGTPPPEAVLDRETSTAHTVAHLEIERTTARDLAAVVEGVPGVQAGSRAGDDVRVSMRGSGLQNVVFGKSRGADVLLDGFPIGGADGNFDYSLISPMLAETVKIRMGAAAARLGSLVLGGAIDFQSPTGLTATDRVRIDAGSFGYVRGVLTEGWADADSDAVVQTEFWRTDGYRDFSSGDAAKAAANWGYRLSETVENRTFINFARVDQDIALPITKQEMEDDPRQGRVRGPPGNFNMNALTKPYFEILTFRLANRLTFTPTPDVTWDLGAYYLYRDTDVRRPSLPPTNFQLGPGWLEARSDDFGGHLVYEGHHEIGGRENTLTAGIRASAMRGNEELFPNMATIKGPKFADGDLRASNTVAFFEDDWAVADNWALVAGARAFHAVRKYEDNMPGGPNGNSRQTYSGIAPKIGFRRENLGPIQLFGSFARNIEPPAFGDIIAIPVIPPPPQRLDLQKIDEQKAWVAELGVRGSANRTNWQVSAYHGWLRDEIIRFSPDPGVNTVGNQVGQNADRTIHYGLEASVRQVLWRAGDSRQGNQLVARGSYTLRRHRFDGDDTFGDNELAGVPTQLLFAEILYEDERGFYFGPNLSGIPASFYIDNANTFKADGFILFGARAGWRGNGWSLFFEGRNLADKAHPAAWQNAIDANGADESVFFPGEGRAFYAGLEIRW